MKIIFAFSSLVLSIIVAKLLSKKYSQRAIFYNDFNLYNNKMIEEVCFERKTVLNIINEFNCESDFIKSIKALYKTPKSKCNLEYLTTEDSKLLCEYFEFLGKSNQETQTKHLNVYQKIIKEKLDNSRQEEIRKNDLYLKMGLMIGLMLFIIII